MRKYTTKYVGLDVHKETIAIALADDERAGEVRNYGTIPHTRESLDKFLRKQVSQSNELRCVYEAGPTGFGLYHYLRNNGIDCIVVAPSVEQLTHLLTEQLVFRLVLVTPSAYLSNDFLEFDRVVGQCGRS